MPRSRNKYKNKITKINGLTFYSKAEAKRYTELCLMQRGGEIEDLQLQPRFDLNAPDEAG